ncbi:MAG: ribonuclease H-like domain-containing protein [Corynebacterium nuruki]|nr:ribonuclease H-like domain-containing protein [Corynebacterium nuruki]
MTVLPSPAPVTPSELSGCRWRSVLRRAAPAGLVHPEVTAEQLADRVAHRHRSALRRRAVWDALPTGPRIGDRLLPTRVDIPAATASDADLAAERTLEAMAAGTRLITGAVLADGALACGIDLLVRTDHGTGADAGLSYMPVAVTAHSVAKRLPAGRTGDGSVRIVDVAALGLADPVPAPLKHRSTPVDSQRVAVAHVLLERYGVASGSVGVIGSGYTRCLVIPAARVVPGLERALAVPVPDGPRRVRECSDCEFHNHCRSVLLARGDLSLMLPGDRGEGWRERGIGTLPALAALADDPAGRATLTGAAAPDLHSVDPEGPALAAAWLAGVGYLRRPLRRWITRPDLWCGHPFRMPDRLTDGEMPMAAELADAVEIDVDMEAHPGRGTFLWGTFDGAEYRAFTDFGDLPDEGAHVARFWSWLMARRAAALADGRVFRAYCYSRQGENHWLRHYAGRFGGREYLVTTRDDDGTPGLSGTVTMPTLTEVNAFLGSAEWVDVFALVRTALAANDSLGLKNVAPLAGFTFSQKDVDGRAAIDLFEVAVGTDRDAASAARRTLERYNADDCYSPAAIRRWLRLGAPGVPQLEY